MRHVGARVISSPRLDVHRLHRYRVRGAGTGAGGQEALAEARQAHVALGDDAPVGLEHGHRVGAVPGAVLAADAVVRMVRHHAVVERSEEHTSELQSLMRISYAVFCLKKKTHKITNRS